MSRPLNVYRFKVELEDFDGSGEVWRTIDVRGDQTLHHLHRAIQSAFDWDDDHLYSFYLSGRHHDKASEYVSPRHPNDPFPLFGGARPRKAHDTSFDSLSLSPGRTIAYLFDYGDEWRHKAVLTKIRKTEDGAGYPRVVDRHGEPPPQYPEWDEDESEESSADDALKELGPLAPLAEKLRAACASAQPDPSPAEGLRAASALALELAETVRQDAKRWNLFSLACDQSLDSWILFLPEMLEEAALVQEAAHLCSVWSEIMQAEHFMILRAEILARAGKEAEAREQLTRNLERFPDDSEVLSRAGRAYRVLKDYAAAESCLRRALAAVDDQRDHERDLTRLISLLREAGKTAEAQALESERLQRRAAAHGTIERSAPKVGRNDPCPCGSGKKFKKCCSE